MRFTRALPERISWASLPRDAALVAAIVFDAYWLVTIAPTVGPYGDGVSWYTVSLADPYALATRSMLGSGAFRYSPAIAQLMAPLALLPWTVYMAGFLALQLAAIRWMAGPRWPLVVLVPPVLVNLYAANVDLLMGAAIVAGFRWPGAWAFLLLTKVTPGVGVLWFAFRREWRSFGIALGTTAAIVAVSLVTVPSLWADWIGALATMTTLPQPGLGPPLLLRLPVAVGLVWFAATTERRWLLPVACFLAMPNAWFVTGAILGASVALSPERSRRRRS